MSAYERRHGNPGKREREAGKRHRRGRIGGRFASVSAEWATLKLGHKHFSRLMRRESRLRQTVAESEKRAKGAPESP